MFLDKDGTLLEDVPYNVDPEKIRLAAGVAPALSLLGALGRPLVVVSNQPGVGLGRFPASALRAVAQRLGELFAAHGAVLAAFRYCPHGPGPDGPRCGCRKPRPGLLLQAARELNLDLARSWMVGDILDDVEAGRRAGCRTILVDVGHETVWLPGTLRVPHFRTRDLGAAAALIATTPWEDAA